MGWRVDVRLWSMVRCWIREVVPHTYRIPVRFIQKRKQVSTEMLVLRRRLGRLGVGLKAGKPNGKGKWQAEN